MEPKFIYTGPSWAASSYPVDKLSTSLAKEWDIDCINTAKAASNVLDNLTSVKTAISIKKLPVIWVYNSVLGNIVEATNVTLEKAIESSEWQDLFDQCNQYCLEKINSLGVPVLLIGAHQDIQDCKYENITIGHHSWQKWLAEKSQMLVNNGVIRVTPADGSDYNLDYCWGAEIVHKIIHENPSIKPEPNLLNAVWDIYYFWEELQRRDWFFEVHPNKRGNVEFAKFLKPVVETFLEEHKNG